MLKKLTKYVKFVVCCVLMLSLMAPSYAALSASDGSAFVTKAEFDSALADFNARLTTFEAGINSKIDSQVTSYLDRNGIWSGKDQDLLNNIGIGIPIPKNGYNMFFSDKTTEAYTGNTEKSFNVKWGTEYMWDIWNTKLCTATKTGLFYTVVNIKSNSTNAKDKRIQFITKECNCSFSSFIELGTGTSTWVLPKLKSTATDGSVTSYSTDSLSDVKYSFLVGTMQADYSSIYWCYPNTLKFACQFFVDTGDDIWGRWWIDYIQGGTGTSFNGKVAGTHFCGMLKAANERPTVKIDVAKIY